jgi:RNA polymerase sigma-70 factor (ECF subfamily)
MASQDDTRISDATLIGRIAAGDSAALEHLARRHQAAVYRFLQAAAPSPASPASPADSDEPADPADPLADTFRAARRDAYRHRDETSARPWLLALARQTIDRRRRAGSPPDTAPLRELAHAAGWGQPEGTGASAFPGAVEMSSGDLDAEPALAALTPPDREILTLCDREYFTLDEAARVTGTSESAAATRLHRARLRLLARLRESPLAATLDDDRVIAGLHCGEVLADLTEHLDGRLAGERAQQVDEHLDGCARCRQVAGGLAAAVRAVRQTPDAPLAAGLEARLLAALREAGAANA